MECYRLSRNRISDTSAIDVPCPGNPDSGGALKCCARGSTCLDNNICFTEADIPSNGSGYYISGCTDQTYRDSGACSPLCTDQSLPDVVYSYTSNLWQCCGTDENNAVTCGTPTSQTFNAPPPAQLRAAFSSTASLSTGSTTSTSSPSSSSILTANASATSSSEGTQASESGSDSGLSGGAIAGIVIGALAVIVLVAGLAFWFGRRRRRIRDAPAHGTADANMLLNTYANHKPALKPYSDRPAQELHSMHTTELQGES